MFNLFVTFVHRLPTCILYYVYLMLLAIGPNKVFLIPESFPDYHTVGSVICCHIVGSVTCYHIVGSVICYHTVGSVICCHIVGSVICCHIVGSVICYHILSQ